MKRDYRVLTNVDDELICAICSDVFYKPVKTKCGHIFCGKCLINWLKINHTCPYCRNTIFSYFTNLPIAKRAEKTKIECLRCRAWSGELGQFKNHRGKNCQAKNFNEQFTQPCIEIVDNEVAEPRRQKKVQIDPALVQQNQLINRFHQQTQEIATQMLHNSLNIEGTEQQDDTGNTFDESLQFMNESEIKEFKQSKKYLHKLIDQLNNQGKEIIRNITLNEAFNYSAIQTIQLTYSYLGALQISLQK